MKTNIVLWLAGVTAVLLLLVFTSVSSIPATEQGAVVSQDQKNVALRAIADALLKQNNDWISPIPPIRREGKNTYFIELEADVDYPGLRATIDNILRQHDIQPNYVVSLLDESDDQVLLGFQAMAQDANGNYPCRERERSEGCYNLQLTFLEAQAEPLVNRQGQDQTWPPVKWVLLGLTCFLPFIWFSWSKTQHQEEKEEPLPDGWQQQNERTAFHLTNQLLKIEDKEMTLTYREAKLLNYFFQHTDQVMERERILEAVWEDEGIIVGRSLDVFVSRLRKKLKADPDLNIVNVHGVGYKLESGA